MNVLIHNSVDILTFIHIPPSAIFRLEGLVQQLLSIICVLLYWSNSLWCTWSL